MPAELESVLRRTNDSFFKEGQWSEEVCARGLLVDLSRIEWVELSAALRVILLVERALLDEVSVVLAMPLEELRTTETVYSDPKAGLPAAKRHELLRRSERRKDVLRFLDRLDFLPALSAPHLVSAPGELTIVSNYDSSQALDAKGGAEEVEETEPKEGLEDAEPFIVPLRWLSDGAPDSKREILQHFVGVVDSSARGIGDRFDAEALADVVLDELVENAIIHSGASRALVAAFAQPRGMVPQPSDFPEAEQDFAEWLSRVRRPNVEVVVGDSGVGVGERLGPAYDRARAADEPVPQLAAGREASVLAWAFSRFSTSLDSPRGGTRGLYRVDRIVNRHLGLLTIRSGGDLVGIDHGGLAYDHVVGGEKKGKKLGFSPGTVVRAQMIAISEKTPDRPGEEPPGDIELAFGAMSFSEGKVLINGSPAERVLGKRPGVCWVLVPQHEIGREQGEDAFGREQWEEAFKRLARARDPDTVAVMGVPHFAMVEDACLGANAEIEETEQHLEETKTRGYEVSDPLLVVGRRPGELAWTGTTETMTAALEELVLEPGARWDEAYLEKKLEGSSLGDAVMLRLRRDRGLATFSDGGVRLRLHPRALAEGVARELAARVQAQLAERPDKVSITPSLTFVRGWVRMDKVIGRDPDLTAPAAFALAHMTRAKLDPDSQPTLLLADASVDSERLRAVAEAIGTRRHETVPGEAGAEGSERIPVAARGDEVVVYADLIAGGASIWRCLSQVLRDDALPLAVACLVDARSNAGEPIDLWGIEVPVISLVQHSTAGEPPATGEKPIYLDGQGRPEPTPPPSPSYPIKPERLNELAIETEAIHFGHIGGNAGRHFTFYVNAQRLLDDAPELTQKLHETVQGWIGGLSDSPRVEVWYPRPEPKVSRPAERLASELRRANPDFRARGIVRERVWEGWKFPLAVQALDGVSVVIVDWGALEGTSLMEMIRLAAEAGAKRILACVCLSQLSPEAEWHLRALRQVEVLRPEPQEQQQTDLLTEPSPPKPDQIPVQVEFLSAIPVRSFHFRDCPVCAELRHLAEHEMPTALLRHYAQQQREERLHLTPREKASEQPIWRLDESLLGGERTAAMLQIRRSLEGALRSTGRRYELDRRLGELTEQLENGGGKEDWEEARDWTRLLGLETQWLERPPLVLDGPRTKLAAVAAAVALADDTEADDRAMAIATLRASSKKAFVAHAPRIFRHAYNEPLAKSQLFYGLFTCIERPYLRSSGIWKELVTALEAMQREILSGNLPPRAGKSEVRVLLARAKLRQDVAELSKRSASDVWSELADLLDFANTNHEVGAAVRRLETHARRDAYPSLDDSERQQVLTDTILDDWEKTEHFLQNEVVPRLRHLSPTLSTFTAEEFFGPNLPWLSQLLDSQISVGEWPAAAIARRVRESRSGGFENRGYWQQFAGEIRRLGSVLLRPKLPNDGMTAPTGKPAADLIRFLDSAPANLAAALRHGRSNCPKDLIDPIEVEDVPEDIYVYFPEPALRELITEILRNVSKHHVSNYSPDSGEATPSTVRIEVANDDQYVRLTIRNTASRTSEESGSLLARYEETLEGFDGNLTYQAMRDEMSPFTFEVKINLRRSRVNG